MPAWPRWGQEDAALGPNGAPESWTGTPPLSPQGSDAQLPPPECVASGFEGTEAL